MTKAQKKELAEWLTERQDIYDNLGQAPADLAYIKGAIRALTLAGLDVTWDEDKESYVVY